MNRFQEVRQKMSSAEFDAILITSQVNRLYVSGFASSAGAMLLTEKEAYFFTDFRYIEAAKAKISGAQVNLATVENSYGKQINEILKEHGISNVGFENEALTYSEYQNWNEKLEAFISSFDLSSVISICLTSTLCFAYFYCFDNTNF